MDTIIVLHDQTIYDIAVNVYGNIQGVFWLMQDNPTLIPDLDTDLAPGTVLKIDVSRKKAILTSKAIPTPALPTKYLYDKVTNGQTIYDRAMQDYGSVDAIFDVINNLVLSSLDDELFPGSVVRIETEKFRDIQAVSFFNDKNIRMNTHENIDFGGVDFWGIEIDFIIS